MHNHLDTSTAPRRADIGMASSPEIVLDRIALPEGGSVWIVRDDLLPGGTKQRAILPYLWQKQAEGFEEFVYASPFAGFAQVALARSAAAAGARCTLFCERDRTASGAGPIPHAFTRDAMASGARVRLTADLGEAARLAQDYAGMAPGRRLELPLGFDCPEFRSQLRKAIAPQWRNLERQLSRAPEKLWVPVGSGTLATVFGELLAGRTEILGASVGVLERSDARIARLRKLGVRILFCSEKFIERASVPAPIPSNVHYDAKLWRLILEYGSDGDVWWNVAR